MQCKCVCLFTRIYMWPYIVHLDEKDGAQAAAGQRWGPCGLSWQWKEGISARPTQSRQYLHAACQQVKPIPPACSLQLSVSFAFIYTSCDCVCVCVCVSKMEVVCWRLFVHHKLLEAEAHLMLFKCNELADKNKTWRQIHCFSVAQWFEIVLNVQDLWDFFCWAFEFESVL